MTTDGLLEIKAVAQEGSAAVEADSNKAAGRDFRVKSPAEPIRLPYPDASFACLYADPPWPEVGGGTVYVRGAQRHYPVMSFAAIEAMGAEVKRVMQPNAHLWLWATNRFLPQALRVMEAWSFEYRNKVTWVKGKERLDEELDLERPGLGQYIRGLSEDCLFGVRGMLPYRTRPDGKRAQTKSVLIAPRGVHSAKPEQMRCEIEMVSAGPYLELFARTQTPGWTAWGNQAQEGGE